MRVGKLQAPAFKIQELERGSTFVIVLWIAFGLVSMTLYFASSMSFELRAADHRVSGIGAEQAIEGAVRYVSSVLANQIAQGSNDTRWIRPFTSVRRSRWETPISG